MRKSGVLKATRLCALLCSVLFFSCGGAQSGESSAVASSDYSAPVQVGTIQTDEVKESSGLAASLCQQNVLWTHNDAGRDSFIYGLNPEGRHLGTWKIPNAQNTDWEDIAAYKEGGKCFLYIGDIGDNDESRSDVTVYRIPEPAVSPQAANSSTKAPLQTESAEAFRFTYADSKHNAETLLVHPQTGDIYIVTKEKKGPASVYKARPVFGSADVAKAEKISDIAVPGDPEGRLTGGAISPDGTRVILCDLKNGYEFKLPAGAADADAFWQQKPSIVNLGDRPQGEAVSYTADGTAIYASSEKKNAPLFLIKRK